MTRIDQDTWTGSDGSAWAAGWSAGESPVGGSTTIQGGYGRQVTGSATGYAFASRTSRRRASQPANVVHRVKFRYTGEVFPQLWVRADSNMRGDTGYNMAISASNWRVNGYSGFGSIFAGTIITQALTAGVDYWAEFGAVGTLIQARLYADGAALPDWQYTTTDATLATGYYGLGAYPGNAGTTLVEWDNWEAFDAFPVVYGDFPEVALPIKAELDIAGVWDDITAYVYQRDGVQISRGRPDEGSDINPTTCTLTLNNRDGRFSPRNPVGAYYGLIGRNTPLKVSVRQSDAWLQINQVTDTTVTPTHVSTSDKTQLDITGDIDIRFEADLESWRDEMEVVSKYTETGNQRSWRLAIRSTGKINFTHSTDGTAAGLLAAESDLPVPILTGRLAIRVTMDVNDGAGNRVRTFYVADTLAGPWTQLGDASTSAGVTSIFSSTALLYLLDNPNSSGFGSLIRGRVIGAEIYSGIAGTLVANPDFTEPDDGATSFADTTGNTWTVTGDATITHYDTRFHGEVTAWPQAWDTTGTDVYSSITASGVLRRLVQGSSIGSALYRGTVRDPNVIAYWPMEDGENSGVFASAFPNGKPIRANPTTVFASDSGFACSDPIPFIGETALNATISNYTSTGEIAIQFLMHIPAGGLSGGSIICTIKTSGTAARWDLLYGTGGLGTLTFRVWDRDDVVITTYAPAAFNVDDALDMIKLRLSNDGADVENIISEYTVGSTGPVSYTNTLAGYQIGRVTAITFNPSSVADYGSVAIGHLAVTRSLASLWSETNQVDAYAGELATARIKRLCEEEEVTYCPTGPRGSDDSVALGPQLSGTLLTLLREAADADLGILYEGREFLELRYRPRVAVQGQRAALTLGYADHQMYALEPVEDDQLTRNDITVQRINGGSARAELTSGPLSTDIPPVGVGRYDTSVSISVEDDSTLADQAGFRLTLGTVDEARLPRLVIGLESSHFAALRSTVARTDVGSRMVITDPPAWLAQLEINQLIQGYTEQLNAFDWGIEFNLSPAAPWTTGVYDDHYEQARYDSGDSLTNEALDTTETGVDVIATTEDGRWTTDASSCPFNILIGGEVMTVNSVSGSGLTQTLDVDRSVNGVIKSHLTGQPVTLIPLTYYAL